MFPNDLSGYNGLPPPDWHPPSEAEQRLNENLAFAAHYLRHCARHWARHPENTWWHLDIACGIVVRSLGQDTKPEIYEGRRLELLHAIQTASNAILDGAPFVVHDTLAKCFASLAGLVADARQEGGPHPTARSSARLRDRLRDVKTLRAMARIATDAQDNDRWSRGS